MSSITYRGSSGRSSDLGTIGGAADGTEAPWKTARDLDDKVEKEANELKDMLGNLPNFDALDRRMENLKEREAQLQAEKKALGRERDELRAAKSEYLRLKKENEELRDDREKLEETLEKLQLSWVLEVHARD